MIKNHDRTNNQNAIRTTTHKEGKIMKKISMFVAMLLVALFTTGAYAQQSERAPVAIAGPSSPNCSTTPQLTPQNVCEVISQCPANVGGQPTTTVWHTEFDCTGPSAEKADNGYGCKCTDEAYSAVLIGNPLPSRPANKVGNVTHRYYKRLVRCMPNDPGMTQEQVHQFVDAQFATFSSQVDAHFEALYLELDGVKGDVDKNRQLAADAKKRADYAYEEAKSAQDMASGAMDVAKEAYDQGASLRGDIGGGAMVMALPGGVTVGGPHMQLALEFKPSSSYSLEAVARFMWSPPSFNHGTYDNRASNGAVDGYVLTPQVTIPLGDDLREDATPGYKKGEDTRTRLRFGPTFFGARRLYGPAQPMALGAGAEAGINFYAGDRLIIQPFGGLGVTSVNGGKDKLGGYAGLSVIGHF